LIIDPHEDRIVAANAAGCAMLGYTHEEMLATPVSTVHPAELPQLRRFLWRVRRDGRGSTIKLRCRTKSGTFLPTEMSLHAFVDGPRLFILGWSWTAASTGSLIPTADPIVVSPADPGLAAAIRSRARSSRRL
jgi:PAS domain S-box-containing protein